jgi:hypothetical protein
MCYIVLTLFSTFWLRKAFQDGSCIKNISANRAIYSFFTEIQYEVISISLLSLNL